MNVQQALQRLMQRQDLDADQMSGVMRQIMTGEATPAQIGGFLVALQLKGETVTEVAAAAEVMRSLATPVDAGTADAMDIVGTGGDASHTFNVSTATAIVTAAAGVKVAKHGNRSASSTSGAADVLEAAGVKLDLSPEAIRACIAEAGVGFMFAPVHHSAMKHAIGPRREMGVRTVFNLLGPLTNPAGVKRQLLGVYSAQWVRPIAEVLQRLGSEDVMVVHGRLGSDAGLDEISLSGPTQVSHLRNGAIADHTVEPEQLGFERAPLSALQVDSPAQSLAVIRDVFDDVPGAPRDMVLLNAGAAIHVGGGAESHAQGIERAQVALTSGAARDTLARLVDVSNRHGASA